MAVGPVLNVMDLRGTRAGADIGLAGAGLVLVGSNEAFGVWTVRAGDVPVAVVPPVVTPADAPAAAFTSLSLLAGAATDAVDAALAWAAARGIPAGMDGASVLALIARFGRAPGTPGTMLLDLREGAEALDPAPLIEAMAAAAPVLFGAATPTRTAIEHAGAGRRFDTVASGLDAIDAPTFHAMSAAALDFVRLQHSPAAAQAALDAALAPAKARVRARCAAWERLGPGGHILVVSDEALNLRHIRVHLPFDAMLARGAIAGYSVLHRGEFVFSTAEITPALRFKAVWVQRSVDPLVALLLRALGRPFVYDLDDNLLLSPSYRQAFATDGIETARAMIRDCAVLSCATARLAAMLEGGFGKAIVTPNLAAGTPAVTAGAARTVVWASSDTPALAGSRAEVERAVRDFCRANALALLCIGAAPPATFAAPTFATSGLAVEHVGLLPYPAYLERLRAAAPGILVGPLETGADAATQGFVDGKSDIKVIEARLAGLQGVFSRAPPYVDSDLAPAILCDNTYQSWLDGLERAYRRCARPEPAPPWPARRDASGAGPMPWAEALRRAQTDVSAAEVSAALRLVRAQGDTLLSAPELFDEADYLRRHEDVADAVAAGTIESAYRHYTQSGFREGRMARRLASPAGDASFWWSRLLHTVSRLEADVVARGHEIDALRDRIAVRRLLPDLVTPDVAAPAPAPPPPEQDAWRWAPAETVALPCPVCDAPGPHPVRLAIGAARLLGCVGCSSAFAEDRTAHEYASEESADVLLQLGLEQNAGIHHQTRLLFAHEGGRSVLDVGCGFGFAVDLAARVLGWRAVGVDPSYAAQAGAAALGADLRQEYLSAQSELGAPFDRVIASEVIEHVPDPYALLATLRAQLAPGGTLALTTPNAAAIDPGSDRGRLVGIVAPGVHLTLFTAASLAAALRRAGFADVAVEPTADTLVAYASDWPLRPDPAAVERHGAAYRQYLEHLLDRAKPGAALWNGAAGRLFALLTPTAELGALQDLFARIAAAWRPTFGIDLARLKLPTLRETRAAALAATQPLNLAGVLLNRALIEQRTPGHTPEAVLAWARPAYAHAVQTRRVLQAENMIDLDLKRTAWRARLLAADCLAALAPELEGELLQGIAAASPGAAADWADPPPDALVARLAAYFATAVGEDRFDDARRVEAALADPDAVVRALASRPDLLLRTLFTRGVQRLLAHQDPAGALRAFERLAAEARNLQDRPGSEAAARDFLRLAHEHMELAATRLSGTPNPT